MGTIKCASKENNLVSNIDNLGLIISFFDFLISSTKCTNCHFDREVLNNRIERIHQRCTIIC